MPAQTLATIFWRRLDLPGHESARLLRLAQDWRLLGAAVFWYDRQPCRLDYDLRCTPGWQTTAARVTGWVGEQTIDIKLRTDNGARWLLNGRPQPAVEGCTDLDLNFSPVTNLLPIRRLALAVGDRAAVQAAWLRFPSFDLEPLDQTYRRLTADVYRYESAGGTFTADLQVNAHGLVLEYPGVWQAISA